MKKIILILFWGFCSIIIHGQNKTINDSTTILNTKVNQIETLDNTYKVLYEETRTNNSELLKSFQWSVGSILLIIIAIFGGSIYFNFRFNKNELSNLLQQVDLKIKDIKSDLLKNQESEIEQLEIIFNKKYDTLSQDFKELQSTTIKEINEYKLKIEENLRSHQEFSTKETSKLSDDFAKKIESISNKYQNQLDTFNDNYKQQINTINQNINKQVDTINTSTEKQINSIAEIFNTKVEVINKDIVKINKSLDEKDKELSILSKKISEQISKLEKNSRRDIARTNALMWEYRKVYSNALRYHIEEISLMRDLNWSINDFYLKEVIENLSHINKLDDLEYNKVLYLIENLPPENIEQVRIIKDLLEQKRT